MMFTALAAAAMLSTTGPGEDFHQALTALEGDWDGVLVYRDFQTNARVELPHQRTVRLAPDGSYAQTDLVFTDPGYQVYASELMTMDGTRVQMASAGRGGISLSEAEILSFEATDTGWTAVLAGSTLDNGEDAQARYTYVIDGDTLSIEKTVRTDDSDPFVFRNGIEMTRR